MKANTVFAVVSMLLLGGLIIWYGFSHKPTRTSSFEKSGITPPGGRRVVRSNSEWARLLTSPQYYITREKGTEGRNSSPLNRNHQVGVYQCVCCQNPLFVSTAKFESGTGWPSFYTPIVSNAIYTDFDGRRTEVLCSVCDAHLGHVFKDGPEPMGLRYCMNGVALAFVKSAITKP